MVTRCKRHAAHVPIVDADESAESYRLSIWLRFEVVRLGHRTSDQGETHGDRSIGGRDE